MSLICLVIPSLEAGGMERVTSELATYLCNYTHHDVHLVLYGRSREIFYNLPENIIIHKPVFEFNNRFRTWFTLKTLHYLRQKIKEIHPDAVLSFGELWNNFVLIALWGTHFTIVVSDRSSPAKRLKSYHQFLRRILYRRAKYVIVQTQKAKEIYCNFIPSEKLIVIPNPIKQISCNNNQKTERENIILSVGRLIHTKHHDRLIRIFAEIYFSDWKLVIIGGNAQKQNNWDTLSKLVADLNLNNRVMLLGYEKNVEEWYLRSSIFAFTSSSEGFPNVVGEALSAGLPVVSYDCMAGPSDMIIHEKNGFLVPVFDDITFAKYLKLLMEDEKLRYEMSLNAKQSITHLSVEKIGEKFTNVLLS